MRRFDDKVAVVTGGGRDIGKAIALRLAGEGAKVVITCKASVESGAEVVRSIEARGGEAFLVTADLTTPEGAERLVGTVRECFGSLDVLVHNTGGMVARRKLPQMDLAFWNEVMAVNLTSLFLTTKALVPLLNDGSAIVALASQAGRDGGGSGALAYATSKGAVITYTRALSKELGPATRVNAICPGMIDTTFHDTFTKPEVRQRLTETAPMRRQGRPEDVAALAAFLASDDAGYVTGAAYDINGGVMWS